MSRGEAPRDSLHLSVLIPRSNTQNELFSNNAINNCSVLMNNRVLMALLFSNDCVLINNRFLCFVELT